MIFLKEFTERDIGGKETFKGTYKIRRSARGILLRGDGKMAIIYARGFGYYKLPGGGLDEGEEIEEAFARECKEEAGCTNINILDELGVVIEYREEVSRMQINYCFVAITDDIDFLPKFTKKEKKNGFSLGWFAPDEVLSIMKQGNTKVYEEKFKMVRDIYLVEKYLEDNKR